MQGLKKEIDNMSHIQMARMWRFAPSDSAYFQGEIGAYFKKSFDDKGGMTPLVSKQIGWNY